MTIKVTAVGADGSESEAATATYDYSKAVTGLTVEAADGALTVSFTPADSGAATDISVYVPATGKIYTAQAAAGETSAVVDVPAGAEADGKEYEMQVTPVGGSAKALRRRAGRQLLRTLRRPHDRSQVDVTRRLRRLVCHGPDLYNTKGLR